MIVLDFIYNEELYTSLNRLVYMYNEVKFYCKVAKLILERDAFCKILFWLNENQSDVKKSIVDR